MYLFPYKDSYSLDTFQKAYDDLSNDSSLVGFERGTELLPTHHALIIRPKNENQQRQIEQNRLLNVRYIPFGYEGINPDTPYGTQYSPDSEGEEECFMDSESESAVNIPNLYVYWPVSLEIPDSLDYDVSYEVFIPDYANSTGNCLSENILFLLEREVQVKKNDDTRYGGQCPITMCSLTVWDSLLEEYVPVPKAKIVIQPGIIVADTTNANGDFLIPSNLTSGFVYAVLQTSNWTVSNNYSTAPVVINLGSVASINSSSSEIVMIQQPSSVALAIQRAAHTFYYGSHSLSCWNPLDFDHIRISIVDTMTTAAGRFYGYANPPYINIKPGNSDARFFTTIHEIGHYAHFNRLGRSTYISRRESSNWYRLIIESFASFAAWDIGRNHYLSNGFLPISSSDDFTSNDRQRWSYLATSLYSPLFVDIVDNHNQYSVGHTYLNDPFYFSDGYSIAREIIDDGDSFHSVQNIIGSHIATVGGDYLDDYMDCFDYWRVTNLNTQY